MDNHVLLEAKNLSMSFGGLKAVSNVNFHVDEGQIVSIIGPNGAGKSTIFNMITGFYVPTEGEIIYKDQKISGMTPQQVVKLGISRTFQNLRIFPTLKVIENVLIGAHINFDYKLIDSMLRTKKYSNEEAEQIARCVEILKELDLYDVKDDLAGSLPYGVQRKVEIARAIATGARLILLDEPAAGMNPNESNDLLDFIKMLQSKGYTIILIEHDMAVVMNVSDYIYVLNFGNLIAEGTSNDIKKNPEVIKAYLGSKDHGTD
jgi:ABC-type branched-chain amino acid transport systems, ATPase component